MTIRPFYSVTFDTRLLIAATCAVIAVGLVGVLVWVNYG